jgi:glucosamine--fructose-6-phosphate aminotransferase (isomerizing)
VAVSGLEAPVEGVEAVLRTVDLEESAAYTASHTAALFVTAQLAHVVSEHRGEATKGERTAFDRIAADVGEIVRREQDVREVAAYSLERRTFCAGAGPDGVVALEAALKAREAAYTTIDALPTEQFLHGPMVTVNADDFAVVVATSEAGRARSRELVEVLDGVGTRTWVIGSLSNIPARASQFVLPEVAPILAPVLAVIPIQLFACYCAQLKGTNADSFRADRAPWDAALKRLTF